MKKTLTALAVLMIFASISWAQTPGYITTAVVTLKLTAQDSGCGLGSGSLMSFSNDGETWSTPENYNETKQGWELESGDGQKTVYAKVSDICGNWSEPFGPALVNLDTTGPIIINIEIIGMVNVSIITNTNNGTDTQPSGN